MELRDGVLAAGGERVADVADLLAEPVAETAVYNHRPTTGFDDAGQGDIHVTFTFAAQRAVVEVDTELGIARVLQVAAAIDAGKVLNLPGFEGQVEGGTAHAPRRHRPGAEPGALTPDDLVGLRPPRATAGPPPVPDVPGQWPVPYYHEQVSTQSRLM